MLNVSAAMQRAAAYNADRIAVRCEDRELTFKQAWERGIRLANALLDLGLKPGDCIAVLEDNCLEASDFFLGTAIANFVRVPLYRRNSAESHAHMMRHTNCKAVVVSGEYLSEIEGISDDVDCLDHVVVRDEGYEDWLASHSNAEPTPKISLDDLHVIRHSGGTTGTSKGMAFTHRKWMTTARDWTYMLPKIDMGDVAFHAGPISHGSGYLFLPIWLGGGCNVLLPKFDPASVLNMLEEGGGYFFAVPTIISDLIIENGDKPRAFNKIKGIVISGAPIRPQTAKTAHALFGDVLHQLYGQTEATPIAWMNSAEWFGEFEGSEPLLACGRVMPFAGLEIRDDDNNRLEPGEVGEVAIQNDGQISEIWDAPELTQERIVDGWILTGDVGRIDANGFLYLVDRKDDLIISGGLNIWPAELELVISELPGVIEVAVVAAPDTRWGETPVAVVVTEDGATLKEEDVIAACVHALGSYKKPSRVVLQKDSLPRTPVGKVQRKVIREDYWKGQSTHVGGS